jgi:hypothetical protein
VTTSNPDPARITDEMWRLWIERPNSAWKLSGIYADKKGYHNTVHKNQSTWPGNYSIKLDLDLKHGNLDKARAIDLTMSDAEMVLWTSRMKKSALDSRDSRLDAVREFYGTLDNKNVYGLIKDSETGGWRQSSADDTHLWHGHTSIFSAFVNNWLKLVPILSVWAGETYEEWVSDLTFPAKQDSGEEVKYWQRVHNAVRNIVTPPLPTLDVDGDYGDATVAAFTDFAIRVGPNDSTYVANKITGWLAIRYEQEFIKVTAPKIVPTPPPTIPDEKIAALVNAYMVANVPKNFKVMGSIEGSIEL